MTYDVVERDPVTNQWVTRHILKPGPTGLITTRTRSVRDQMGTRVLELGVCDSEEQTREVVRVEAAKAAGKQSADLDVSPFIALADCHEVIVPVAEFLGERVPVSDVRMRRDFKKLISVVQSSALLHQVQRERRADGAIIATLGDYELAHRLLSPVFDMMLTGGLTPAVRETVEAVEDGEEITQTELARRLEVSLSTVQWRVRRALRGGWLVNNETRRYHPAQLARGGDLPEMGSALPSPRECYEWTTSRLRVGTRSLEANAGAKTGDGYEATSQTGEVYPPLPPAAAVADVTPNGGVAAGPCPDCGGAPCRCTRCPTCDSTNGHWQESGAWYCRNCVIVRIRPEPFVQAGHDPADEEEGEL
mgnify:CR=1 FL=1